MQEQRIALISVADKDGLIPFAQGLADLGWGIIGSRGTKKVLNEAGILAVDVAEFVVGGPILGHKVVTLSREIHAGILANPNDPEEVAQIDSLGMKLIDLVYVGMYPLVKAIQAEGATIDSVRENTDVGGPTMLHAAAKGGRIVLCDPADRAPVLAWLQKGMPNEKDVRLALAAKAERTAALYVAASALYLESQVKTSLAQLLAA